MTITAYELGFNNTLYILQNELPMDKRPLPPAGKDAAYYRDWWQGVADAYQHHLGSQSILTQVEDKVCYATAMFLAAVGLVTVGFSLAYEVPVGAVAGFLAIAAGVNLWRSTTKTIRQRATNAYECP